MLTVPSCKTFEVEIRLHVLELFLNVAIDRVEQDLVPESFIHLFIIGRCKLICTTHGLLLLRNEKIEMLHSCDRE